MSFTNPYPGFEYTYDGGDCFRTFIVVCVTKDNVFSEETTPGSLRYGSVDEVRKFQEYAKRRDYAALGRKEP